MPDINKFNFTEIFNNDTGKTSASSFISVIGNLIAFITFAYGCIMKDHDMMNNSITIIITCSSLLGVRKLLNNRENIKDEIKDEGESK